MSKVEIEAARDRVTVQEAAHRLGVKDDAIRKRIQRGTLVHEKDLDGRVYVFLDQTHDTAQDNTHHSSKDVSRDPAKAKSQDVSKDILVDALQDQIRYLREIVETRDRELEARTEELRRKDTIIMSLTQRVPELTTASSPEDLRTHDGLLHSPGKGEDGKTSEDSQVDLKRPWWRKLFGA